MINLLTAEYIQGKAVFVRSETSQQSIYSRSLDLLLCQDLIKRTHTRDILQDPIMEPRSKDDRQPVAQRKIKVIASETTPLKYGIDMGEIVGFGGYGTVYRAFDLTDPERKQQQRLVCKVVPIKKPQALQEVKKQFSILKELPEHPNLVKTLLLDCYSENNYYIFMEFCEGGTLSSRIRARHWIFLQEDILDLFYQLIQGYNQLYNLKIIHHDIKPGNILISSDYYKFADFGMSVFEDKTKQKQKGGTLFYLAPEKVIKNLQVSSKSDIYSLGVMLYMIITKGVHPYCKNLGASDEDFFKDLFDPKNKPEFAWLYRNYSNSFQQEFCKKLIQPMIKKHPADRVNFEFLYNAIKYDKIFEKFRIRERRVTAEQETKYFFLEQQRSKIIKMELLRSHRESEVEQLLRSVYDENPSQIDPPEEGKDNSEILSKLRQYIQGHRVVVSCIDALARTIQSSKGNLMEYSATEEELLAWLWLLNQKILKHLIHEMNNPQHFTVKQWAIFKMEDQKRHFQTLLTTDMVDARLAFCALAAHQEPLISNFQELDIFYNTKTFEDMLEKVIPLLKVELESLIKQIKVTDRVKLSKIGYILKILDIGKSSQGWLQRTKDIKILQQLLEEEPQEQLFNRICEIAKQEQMIAPQIIDIDFS